MCVYESTLKTDKVPPQMLSNFSFWKTHFISFIKFI